MLIVISVGLFIGVTGAAGLYVAFRAFGSEKPRDVRPAMWIAALLAFVFIGCVILLRLSLRRG